jgi:hypothetical protein
MEKKKIIILIILAALAVLSVANGLRPSSRRNAVPASETALEDALPDRSSDRAASGERRAAKSAFASWGRNPFRKREAIHAVFGEINVSGIMWDEKNPRAMVNDMIVRPGNKIGSYRVVAIKKDRVILNDGTNDYEFLLQR